MSDSQRLPPRATPPTGPVAPASIRRALIVDDRLSDQRGHQLGFVAGMAAWLAQRGFVVEVWAHRTFEPALTVPGASVRRLFRVSWLETFMRATPRRRPFAVLAHNWRFFRQLRRAGRGSPGDLVIADANVFHLFAWRIWLALAPRRTVLLLVFVHPPWLLHFSPVDGSVRPKFQARAYLWALRWLQKDLRSGRCRLAADSQAVATYLRHGGRWPVAEIVVPVSEARSAGLSGPPPPCGGGLRLGVLGRPVREHGIDRVLAAIELWCATAQADAPAVRFVLQWQPAPFVHAGDRAKLEQLAARFPRAIETIEHALDDEAFARLLVSLHGGLLAYNRADFANRASYVATECLCAGRPLVTTAGTWMARELDARGAGVTCDESPAGIVAAIATFVRDYDSLAARARSRQPLARDHYSMSRFFGAVGLATRSAAAGESPAPFSLPAA